MSSASVTRKCTYKLQKRGEIIDVMWTRGRRRKRETSPATPGPPVSRSWTTIEDGTQVTAVRHVTIRTTTHVTAVYTSTCRINGLMHHLCSL